MIGCLLFWIFKYWQYLLKYCKQNTLLPRSIICIDVTYYLSHRLSRYRGICQCKNVMRVGYFITYTYTEVTITPWWVIGCVFQVRKFIWWGHYSRIIVSSIQTFPTTVITQASSLMGYGVFLPYGFFYVSKPSFAIFLCLLNYLHNHTHYINSLFEYLGMFTPSNLRFLVQSLASSSAAPIIYLIPNRLGSAGD